MNYKYLLITVFISGVVFSHQLTFAQPNISLLPVASGFDQPTDISHAGDDRLFIVEKAGIIRILDENELILNTPFLDISDQVRSVEQERGLLGLAFHPDFESNGWFFVNFTDLSGNTQVSRFSVNEADANQADLSSEVPILNVEQDFSNHNGGDLAFGPDGFLYIGMGDGGSGNDPNDRGQANNTLLGKMLRIDVSQGDSYQIPDDNPFVNDPEVLDEIWASGLRNPWRFSFDRLTGDMWIADVGQVNREEVSFQEANSGGGENYGWVCFEGTRVNDDCELTGSVSPVFEYGRSDGISVTGGFVYRGNTFPDLVGYYVLADFVTNRFWTINQEEDGSFNSNDLGVIDNSLRISSFGEDVNGELYAVDFNGGNLFQITTDNPVSINPSQYQNLQLFPNPARQSISLNWDNPGKHTYTFSVLDLQGREIARQTGITGDEFSWNTESVSEGMYLIKLTGETISNGFTGKVIINQ